MAPPRGGLAAQATALETELKKSQDKLAGFEQATAEYADLKRGAEEKGKKTKILICSHGNASPEERAKRLEQAIERVNKNEELSAESKARITTALRDAIAQINAPTH